MGALPSPVLLLVLSLAMGIHPSAPSYGDAAREMPSAPQPALSADWGLRRDADPLAANATEPRVVRRAARADRRTARRKPGKGARRRSGKPGKGAAARGNATSPFIRKPKTRFPALIHQTVKDKSFLSCQQRETINTWIDLNPGYKYVLWDDADARALVATHYSHLLSVYDSLGAPVERADWFRYLVVHQYGGVYADVDVRCMQPVSRWNEEHGHDAEVLVGTEFEPEGISDPVGQFEQWTLVAAKKHPLLLYAIEESLRHMSMEFLTMQSTGVYMTPEEYEKGILARTGPTAWTNAVYRYLMEKGHPFDWIGYGTILSKKGFVASGVRLMPKVSLGEGWDAAADRGQAGALTCGRMEVAPRMLVCHQFWGSWKSDWDFKVDHEHEECASPVPRIEEPLALDRALMGALSLLKRVNATPDAPPPPGVGGSAQKQGH